VKRRGRPGRFTEEQVRAIRATDGVEDRKAVAERLGCSPPLISAIIHRTRYKWVK